MSYSEIARNIQKAAKDALNGGWRSSCGVCYQLADYNSQNYYYEIYNVTHYLMGDVFYNKGLGHYGVFNRKRRAFCEKIANLSHRQMRRYVAQAFRVKREKGIQPAPLPAFSFLSKP